MRASGALLRRGLLAGARGAAVNDPSQCGLRSLPELTCSLLGEQQPLPSTSSSTLPIRFASTFSSRAQADAANNTGWSQEPLPSTSGANSFPLPEESPSSEVMSAILQACGAAERAAVQGATADAWFGASWCISGLCTAHEYLGTPWWLSIAIFNITMRTVFFPLMVVGQKAMAKMMAFNHSLLHAKELQEASVRATSHEEHQRLANAARAEYQAQIRKMGNPLTNALTMPAVMIGNAVVFMSVFTGVSKLMAAQVPSLTTGGALWFTDLTQSDAYFGLPIMCTLVTLAMVEYGINLSGDPAMPAERQQMAANMKWFLRLMAFMFIPAGGYVASGTAMLWVSNTGFGVLQGLLLRNDKFRRTVGLPTMQELRDMSAQVAEATAASSSMSPQPPGAPPSPAAAAAAKQPLLSNPPKGAARAGGSSRA